MSEVSLETLVSAADKDAILARLLVIAAALNLDTETWASGDPTRTLFDALSRMIEADDPVLVDAINGGFIGLAEGDWLTLAARYMRNTERIAATAATCTIQLTNAGGANYTFDAGDVTVRNSATGATYRSTTGGTLVGGGTLDLEVEAEEAGTDSNSGVGDIDELVVALPNVTVTNTTAAAGTDEESDDALEARANAKLGALSPAGPALGYEYIAKTPEFNGGVTVTRTRVLADSDTNAVTVYLADADGAVSEPTRASVEDGLETWANPATVLLTVTAASNYTLAITYELWVYDEISMTESEVEALVEEALLTALSAKAIGGDVIPPATTGKVYQGWIEAAILAAVDPHGFRVSVTVPAADVSLTIGQVAVLGTVTPTVHLVAP